MKTVTTKRKEFANTTFFLSLKELTEIRDNFSEIINSEKEHIIFKSDEYDLVLTKGKEEQFTLTFDCKSSN